MYKLITFKHTILFAILILFSIAYNYKDSSDKYDSIMNKTECGVVDISKKYYHSNRYFYVPVIGKKYTWYIVLLVNDINKMKGVNVCKKYIDIFKEQDMPIEHKNIIIEHTYFGLSLITACVLLILLLLI